MIILLLIGIWVAYTIFCSDKYGTEKYICFFITVVGPLVLYFFLLNPYLDKKERRNQDEKKEQKLLEEKKEKVAETEIANSIINFYTTFKYKISDYNDKINIPNNGVYKYICRYCSIDSNFISLDDFGSTVLIDNIDEIVSSNYQGKGILLELYNMKAEVKYQDIEYEGDEYNCYGTQEYLVSTISFNGKVISSMPLYDNFEDEYDETQSHLKYRDRIQVYQPNIIKQVLDKMGKDYEVLFDQYYIDKLEDYLLEN